MMKIPEFNGIPEFSLNLDLLIILTWGYNRHIVRILVADDNRCFYDNKHLEASYQELN